MSTNIKMIQSLENQEVQKQLLEKFKKTMNSGFYTDGDMVVEAENAVGNMYDMPAVAMNSAGSGLFAMSAYFKKISDPTRNYVVIPSNTYFATAAMAIEAGFKPIFIDNREDDPSMSADALEQAIRKYREKIAGVILVHIGGLVALDYEAIASLCKKHNLFLMEDAAHAFGMKEIGSLSDGAVFSMFATKAVPVGQAGFVITKNSEIEEYMRRFRNYGKYFEDGEMRHDRGFNFRMDEWAACVAGVQVRRTDEIIAARSRDSERLYDLYGSIIDPNRPSNHYKHFVHKDSPAKRRVGGVYGKTHQMKHIFADSRLGINKDYILMPTPNADKWAEDHVCLFMGEGLYDNMTDDEIRNYLENID